MKFITKPVLFLTIFLLGLTAQNAQTTSPDESFQTPKFKDVIEEKLLKYKVTLAQICPIETNLAARRVFYDYGAIFISNNGGILPRKCIFESDFEVNQFQKQVSPQTENIGGVRITLQEPAMEALIAARKEARQKGLSITPRGGSISGSRSFQDTYKLWNSRFYPALNYWVKRRKISRQDAADAKALPIQEQVAKVLEWEQKGFYFSTGFNKSILYSVAAPGASQHIFMLALDVKQYNNSRVRKILAKHHWYQTVKSDLPHFTYLGEEESKLPSLGLKATNSGGYKFWIPNK